MYAAANVYRCNSACEEKMAGGNNSRLYIREISKGDPKIQGFTKGLVNLADERLGAEMVEVSDQWYAPAQRMLNHRPAIYYYHDEEGTRYVDGWETARRRREGHEYCVIRLGRSGRIRCIVFDTSFYTGNFPVGAAVEACNLDLNGEADWQEIVPFVPLSGNSQLLSEVQDNRSFTHVRVRIYPDGGMARIRVFGDVTLDENTRRAGVVIDLAAMENGGRIVGCSDTHFGSVQAMIAPGPDIVWGKGWETRRLREPGNDWAVIALGCPGIIDRVELDTKFYTGNYPAAFSLQATAVTDTADKVLENQAMYWPTLLNNRQLRGGENHVVYASDLKELGAVTHIRLNIFPDGGVTRFKVFARPVLEFQKNPLNTRAAA
jgi:allantoicase